MVTYICSNCGKIIERKQKNNCKNHFCCNDCKAKFQYKKNNIKIEQDYAIISINYKSNIIETKVDIEDIEKIKELKWHVNKNHKNGRFDVYAFERNNFANRKYIALSRYLMNCTGNIEVDHINHNTLDNRKQNLRICTKFKNQQNKTNNTSGYIGIVWDKSRNKWKATVEYKCKRYNLGRFETKEEAIIARENFVKNNNIY